MFVWRVRFVEIVYGIWTLITKLVFILLFCCHFEYSEIFNFVAKNFIGNWCISLNFYCFLISLKKNLFPYFKSLLFFKRSQNIVFQEKIFEQNSRMMGIKNKVLEWCTGYFFNPIQDVLFRVCSWIGGGGPSSLKSAIRIL